MTQIIQQNICLVGCEVPFYTFKINLAPPTNLINITDVVQEKEWQWVRDYCQVREVWHHPTRGEVHRWGCLSSEENIDQQLGSKFLKMNHWKFVLPPQWNDIEQFELWINPTICSKFCLAWITNKLFNKWKVIQTDARGNFLFHFNYMFYFRNGQQMGNHSPNSGRGASRRRGPTGSRRGRTLKHSLMPLDSQKWRSTTSALRWFSCALLRVAQLNSSWSKYEVYLSIFEKQLIIVDVITSMVAILWMSW